MIPELAALAQAQGGVFSRRQALDAGYSADAVRHRVSSGRWHALRRGWYVDAHRWARAQSDRRVRTGLEAAAVVGSLGVPAYANRLTAARLHGADLLTEAPVLTFTADRADAERGRRGPGYRLGVSTVPPEHRGSVSGVPVTSPARTFVDVARSAPLLDAIVVADSLLRETGVSQQQVERVLRDAWTWAGIRRVHRVLAAADGRAESPLESVLRVGLAAEGLTQLEPQVEIWAHGRFRARVDLADVFAWTVVEGDGAIKYADPRALLAEKRRQEDLEQLGLVVVRADWMDARHRWARTAARVHRARELAARRVAQRDPTVEFRSTCSAGRSRRLLQWGWKPAWEPPHEEPA